MTIGNVEIMHMCFPKHWGMGTTRTKLDQETDEESKQRGVSCGRSKADTQKKFQRPIYSSGLPPPPGSMRLEAVDELPN